MPLSSGLEERDLCQLEASASSPAVRSGKPCIAGTRITVSDVLEYLADHSPYSLHVADLDLQGASDLAVWTAARGRGLVLVSKDDDFQHLALVRGAPPKVVILKTGNPSTDAIAVRLLDQQIVLENVQRGSLEHFARPVATDGKSKR